MQNAKEDLEKIGLYISDMEKKAEDLKYIEVYSFGIAQNEETNEEFPFINIQDINELFNSVIKKNDNKNNKVNKMIGLKKVVERKSNLIIETVALNLLLSPSDPEDNLLVLTFKTKTQNEILLLNSYLIPNDKLISLLQENSPKEIFIIDNKSFESKIPFVITTLS